jgi:hypothetical protein
MDVAIGVLKNKKNIKYGVILLVVLAIVLIVMRTKSYIQVGRIIEKNITESIRKNGGTVNSLTRKVYSKIPLQGLGYKFKLDEAMKLFVESMGNNVCKQDDCVDNAMDSVPQFPPLPPPGQQPQPQMRPDRSEIQSEDPKLPVSISGVGRARN